MDASTVKNRYLLAGIITGALLGAVFGTFFPQYAVKAEILGDIFLNALKMMVLPLIVTSMIVGITNIGSFRSLGTLGAKTLIYYMVTTGIAVSIGIMLVLAVSPGEGFSGFAEDLPEQLRGKEKFSFTDVISGLIHPNLVQAASEMQILPIIIASILFGISFTCIGEKAEIVVRFFSALNDAVIKIVQWIMYFAPAGVFGLIAYRLGITGGGEAVGSLIIHLGKYFVTVVLGLALHGIIVLPLILFLFTRRNPWEYFLNLGKALVTAFSTASSSATLPVTLECATEEASVSARTASFVLPLGATVNMDGTALYEAVAAIFIAQSYNITLEPAEVVIIFFTATLAAIGAAGIPEAGLVTMVLVLQSVGLPLEGIGIILSIDWLLDRLRTTVNVWGDAVGSAVIDYSEIRAGKS